MKHRHLRTILALAVASALAFSAFVAAAPALAAGADNWNFEGPGGLMDGFNLLQDSVADMCVFNSALFAGTGGGWSDGGQVWRYDGSKWALANSTGFGEGNLISISSLAVYGGYLYAAGPNGASGCQVWRTNGAGSLPYRWTKVSSESNVGMTGNYDVPSMAAAAGGLYVGTSNNTGCRVWKYSGTTWSQCVGQGPPASSTGPGFGKTSNIRADSMTVSPAGLVSIGTYCGTGCDVWSGTDTVWSRTNLPGFQNANNDSATTMSYFNGKLYAATYNSNTGCEVWRYYGPNQWNWAQVNTDGFGNAANIEANGSAVFGSTQHLYVVTANEATGCRVWRYSGSAWEQASASGFGDPSVKWGTEMAAHGGRLYAAAQGRQGAVIYSTAGGSAVPHGWTLVNTSGFTENDNMAVTSSAFFRGDLYVGTLNQKGCEVLRRGPLGWERVAQPGFGDTDNITVFSMFATGSFLYAGTGNGVKGCQVWRYDGTGWTRINKNGFGNAQTTNATSMIVHGGKLYVGTQSYSTLARVWRFDGPGVSDWTKVSNDGFGTTTAVGAVSMAVHGGKLHVGAYDANDPCRVWRYDGSGPSGWTAINKPGFGVDNNRGAYSLASYGGKLYTGTYNAMHTGCEIYRYSGSGTSWSKIGASGMGDAKNITAASMAVFDNRLFVGTINVKTGCEVWSYDGSTLRQSNADGFGKVLNREVGALATDGTRLAAGVYNEDTGCEVWVTEKPPSTWYLAEGTTAWGFDTCVTIENPNSSAVTADITYMTDTGAVSGGTVKLPAKSQATVNPAETLGQRDFSTKVACREGAAICVDRTMRWTGPGAPSEEGHCSVGVTGPARTWYLAEGSTGWGFECWLLVQNPNATEARCQVTYMIEGEGPRTFEKTVPANSRATYNMADDIGAKDASIEVSANVPVIPERAMYRNNRREGHDSIGTTTPSTDYFLAEGTTAWGFTTYVLVQNPNDTEATVTLTYMTGAGPKSQAPFKMPAGSRKTIRVNDVLPDTDLSTRVQATKPIIAERAMYWGEGTPLGEACHDSIGMKEPHSVFYLPDGETGNGRETWTLVQNPNPVEVSIEVTYMRPDGKNNVTFTDKIPADSRSTYNMADAGFTGRAAVMVRSKTEGRRIMVERAMYWNSRGAGTVTIGGYFN